MNEQLDADERLGVRLGAALDTAVRPFDPITIATRAANESRRSMVHISAVTVVAAVAVITAIGLAGQLRFSGGGGTGGSVANETSPEEPSRGPVPESAWRADGTIDLTQVPDFIPATDGDETVGWISRDDAFPSSGTRRDPLPVYGDDLRTIVGDYVGGAGYVPLGVDPQSLTPGPQPTFWAEDAP